jgi:hypothetical protein
MRVLSSKSFAPTVSDKSKKPRLRLSFKISPAKALPKRKW